MSLTKKHSNFDCLTDNVSVIMSTIARDYLSNEEVVLEDSGHLPVLLHPTPGAGAAGRQSLSLQHSPHPGAPARSPHLYTGPALLRQARGETARGGTPLSGRLLGYVLRLSQAGVVPCTEWKKYYHSLSPSAYQAFSGSTSREQVLLSSVSSS